MTLVDNIKTQQNYTLTENGALALNSSNSALVNLFGISGALRNRSENDIKQMFSKALVEDKLLATKLAFYTRDIREGLGERRVGRIMFNYLGTYYPNILDKNLELISEYGRFDDLVYLMDKCPRVVDIIKKQLDLDLLNMANNESISLLAKWLPSINTSNKDVVYAGKKLACKLGMSEKQYRKTLSSLRNYINIVETNLSQKNYDLITYSKVPSKAMNKYRNAFKRNDEKRFETYINNVSEGKEKINSSTLYPYDIVEKYLCHGNKEDKVLEEQWKALPNFIEGENNFIVMADVSGSMSGRPMATSIGLAMYFAEHNKGAFGGTFMTFSARPELVTIKGDSLFEKINYIQNADWDANTNLEAAFDLVLNTAIKYKTKKEDLPTSIVVITDMEIDVCSNRDWLFYDQMKAKFEKYGYQIPNIVFWNVNARNNTYHASFDRCGVQLASGQSPIVFKSLISGLNLTPYDYMLSVLNAPRYDSIQI